MRRPAIVYGVFCSCGWTGTGSPFDRSIFEVEEQFKAHVTATVDGFEHKRTGFNVVCLSCRAVLVHHVPQPKFRCVEWAKRHKSLGCTQ